MLRPDVARVRALLLGSLLALTVLAPAPASAADETESCDAGSVTVVVEPRDLGGEASERCVPVAEGDTALDAVKAAGHDVEGSGEFGDDIVCRVDGRPDADAESCQSMPAADAYWTFWLAVGDEWAYAEAGVASQAVTEGDVLALVFQQGADEVTPTLAPAEAAEAAVPPQEATDGSGETSTDASTGWALGWGVVVVLVLLVATGLALRRRRRP